MGIYVRVCLIATTSNIFHVTPWSVLQCLTFTVFSDTCSPDLSTSPSSMVVGSLPAGGPGLDGLVDGAASHTTASCDSLSSPRCWNICEPYQVQTLKLQYWIKGEYFLITLVQTSNELNWSMFIVVLLKAWNYNHSYVVRTRNHTSCMHIKILDRKWDMGMGLVPFYRTCWSG